MASVTRRARVRTALDPARQVAYDALRAVVTQDAYLNLIVPRLLTEREVTRRDAAFATELASGTTRMQGTYDAVLEHCTSGGVQALQPDVLTALRLGCHQLLSMRVSPHAAVTTTVELVRSAVGERPVRLVNAVLRRVGSQSFADWVSRVAPDRAVDLVGHLAVRHSHPRWVVHAFLDALETVEETEAALAADNVAPAVSLVIRPGLCSVDELLAYGGRRGRWSPYAVQLDGGDPGDIRQVRSARAGVQDEGSQLAALVLERVEVAGQDRRWLDMCAGPGGKAALLTGLATDRGAVVVAADSQPHRARLVRQALRAYSASPPVVAADGTRAAWALGAFDRVLVDAPCSGLGALRRRPEARWRRRPDALDGLVALQKALLGSALAAVRPGGAVVYATCSPHRAETRGVVEAVLTHRSDVREEDAQAMLADVPDLGPGPSAQLWPHRHGTDAMFIAVLRRVAAPGAGG